MCNHFTKRESEYDLRDQNVVALHVPNFKTITYGRKSFIRYCGAYPPHIRSAATLKCFKEMIKPWPGPSCDCVLCKAH